MLRLGAMFQCLTWNSPVLLCQTRARNHRPNGGHVSIWKVQVPTPIFCVHCITAFYLLPMSTSVCT